MFVSFFTVIVSIDPRTQLKNNYISSSTGCVGEGTQDSDRIVALN